MNQFQFEAIVKCIRSGAPAMAEELIGALVSVVETDAKIRNAAENASNGDKEVAVKKEG